MDGFLQTYMESDDGTEEKFSFDRFMLEQDKRWDGPYLIGDSDDYGNPVANGASDG